MRAASRLLAAVSQPSSAARLLEPGTPTGLTGLLTHPAPRSTLLYLYSSTLSKLQRMPETSVYRRATEALTKQRMAIIERVKPPGFDAWEDNMKFRVAEDVGRDDSEDLTYEDRWFVKAHMWQKPVDIRDTKAEWDGETIMAFTEGPLSQEERDAEMSQFDRKMDNDVVKRPVIDPEPLFTVEQIADLEQQFGSGLLEEVIQVAEGENKLADVMLENQVWEDLVEQAPEGQWSYFERPGSQ